MKMLPLLILLTAGTLADARLQNNQGTGANTDFADAVRATVELQSQGLDEATVRVHRAYIYRDSARQWSDDLPGNLKLVAIDVTFQGYSAGLDLDDVDIIDAETSRNYGSDPILFGVLPDGRPADIDDPAVLRREGSLRTCIREPRHLIIRCGREFGEADRYIELDQAMRHSQSRRSFRLSSRADTFSSITGYLPAVTRVNSGAGRRGRISSGTFQVCPLRPWPRSNGRSSWNTHCTV